MIVKVLEGITEEELFLIGDTETDLNIVIPRVGDHLKFDVNYVDGKGEAVFGHQAFFVQNVIWDFGNAAVNLMVKKV